MICVRNLLAAFIAAMVLSGGSAIAADAKSNPGVSPAPGSSNYGVIESIEPAKVRDDGAGGAAGGNTAAGPEAEKSRSTPAHFVFRVRLDDGRYQGFHQPGSDELRVGDRVQIEIDRLRRAQEQGKVGK